MVKEFHVQNSKELREKGRKLVDLVQKTEDGFRKGELRGTHFSLGYAISPADFADVNYELNQIDVYNKDGVEISMRFAAVFEKEGFGEFSIRYFLKK